LDYGLLYCRKASISRLYLDPEALLASLGPGSPATISRFYLDPEALLASLGPGSPATISRLCLDLEALAAQLLSLGAVWILWPC